jgi:hypothetical protein
MFIFFKKKGLNFFKKSLGATEFYEKMDQKKNPSRLYLLSFNSKLRHFDKSINFNLNLKHKCLSPTGRKPIWFLIYGEACGHSELAWQIYGERASNFYKRCAASSRFRAFRYE